MKVWGGKEIIHTTETKERIYCSLPSLVEECVEFEEGDSTIFPTSMTGGINRFVVVSRLATPEPSKAYRFNRMGRIC